MTRRRRMFANAFAAISAAMLGLATGALWMLPTTYLRSSLPWLAVPLGALLGWAIAHWVLPRRGAALLAALATLLAAAYVSVLIAAARLAGNMDMGLVEAMRIAGAGMLWSLVRLSLDVVQLVQRGLGLAAFRQGSLAELLFRDLAMYLRQPAPDETLTAAAAHFMQRDLPGIGG